MPSHPQRKAWTAVERGRADRGVFQCPHSPPRAGSAKGTGQVGARSRPTRRTGARPTRGLRANRQCPLEKDRPVATLDADAPAQAYKCAACSAEITDLPMMVLEHQI